MAPELDTNNTTPPSVPSLIPVPVVVRRKSPTSSRNGGDSPKSQGSSVDSGFVRDVNSGGSGGDDDDDKGRHKLVRKIDRVKIERRRSLFHTKIPLRVERSSSFSTTSAEQNFQARCIQRQIFGYFHKHYHPKESLPQLVLTGSSQLSMDRSGFGGSDSLYFDDLLENEFEKEDKYNLLFKLTKPKEHIHVQLRSKIVQWMISASVSFKYSVNTMHVAVFFMDAMAQVTDMKVVAWPLLGLTALHLAAKMEEPSAAKLQLMWGKYKNLAKYKKSEISWMEHFMLKALGFRLNPPTPKFFTDIGFESGEIFFPSVDIIRLVRCLTDSILLNGLLEYDVTFIKSSLKASLAMQIATHYVLLYSEQLLSATIMIGESEELKKATRICTARFLNQVRCYTTPHYFAQDDSPVF